MPLQVLKQSEDPKFGQYSELPAEGSSSGGGGHLGAGPYAAGLAWRGEGAGPRYAVPYQTQGGDAYTELSVLLLEEQGMMLFGRDGSGVADVQQVRGGSGCLGGGSTCAVGGVGTGFEEGARCGPKEQQGLVGSPERHRWWVGPVAR